MTKCLLVDDSATQRKIMRKIVEQIGLDVDEADNGLKAIEYCENYMPDMIILDMNMPEMDGLEFLEALSVVPKKYEPHIIMCSATIDTDMIVKSIKAGADEYHCKSTDVEKLREKITNAPCVDGG